MKLLAILAEARQAAISEATLTVYSAELAEFEQQDLQIAIRELMLTPRAEGQTAFPDLGTIRGHVIKARNKRTSEERAAQRRREEEELERHRREHPEEYKSIGVSWEEFNAKIAAKRQTAKVLDIPARRPEEKPRAEVCETCGRAKVVAGMTPAELRELADVLDKVQAKRETA